MAEWDDDNFVPGGDGGSPGGGGAGALSNKWEGEDEDDEVKDNWEDEEEEKKMDESNEVKSKSKKISLVDKIAEREKLKREEYEKRKMEEDQEELSPEEQMRRQQESDLSLALETTFGVANENGQPKTKEEYLELADTLTKNIQQYSKTEEYPIFAENIIRGVCTTLTSFDLKKIKTTIDNLYLEKQKLEKGDKSKKAKGKGKAKLRMEGDNPNLYSSYVTADFDEYDDFM